VKGAVGADGHGTSKGSGVKGAVGADGHGTSKGSGVEGAVGPKSKEYRLRVLRD
jgi:hypothetical protein